jgi:hypothetical protein
LYELIGKLMALQEHGEPFELDPQVTPPQYGEWPDSV